MVLAATQTHIRPSATIMLLARAALAALLILAALLALLLLVNRLFLGGMSIAPGSALLLAVGLSTASAAAKLFVSRTGSSRQLSLWLVGSTLVALVMLTATAPLSFGILTVLSWLLFISAEAAGWYTMWPRDRSENRTSQTAAAVSAPTALVESTNEEVDGSVSLQQLHRIRTEQGQDVLFGTLTAEFAPGERVQSIHVAVCPPMDHRPACDVQFHSGPDAQIDAAVVEPYAARFDIRLRHAQTGDSSVTVEFQLTDDGG